MNKKIALAVVSILLAVAVGAVVWSMRPAPPVTGAALPTFDYAAADSWAIRPAQKLPAVWEAGWDVDVVLLAAEAALEPNDRIAPEKRLNDADGALNDLAAAFESVGAVYAPYLRAANLEADISAAFHAYLSADNRGRAFVIATDAPLPAEAASRLAADPLLRDRFAGVVFFGDADDAQRLPEGVSAASICSRRYTADEGCILDVALRRSGGKVSVTGDGPVGGRLVSGLVPWLNDHASKLAEPLGELEEVEIIEIRRPGETGDAAENQD